MALTASQYRKAVREGKIEDEVRITNYELRKRSPEARSPKPTHHPADPATIAARLAICGACPTRQVEGQTWRCIRCETPDFRCWRTADLRHKAAVAEAVCYEGKWTH